MAWTPKFTFSVTWDNITGKPLNYPTTWSLVGGKPSTFPSTWATVSGKPETATRWPAWGEVTGKPSTFAPSSHTHTIANVTGLQTALDAKFDSPSGTTSQYIRGNGSLATFPSIPAGTVTSVTGGNGLSGSVTSSGSLTLGTPSNITLSSTNSVTTTSHTHSFAPGGTTSQYIRGNGSLATFPSIPDAADFVARAIPDLDPIAEIESGNYGTVMQPFRIGRNSSIDPPTFSTNLSPYLWLGASGSSGQQGALIAVHAAAASSNQQMAFRGRSASGWGPWSYLWHSGNFDPDSKAPVENPVFEGDLTVSTSLASGGVIVERRNQPFNSSIEYKTTDGSLWAGYGNNGTIGFSVGGSSNLTASNTWFKAQDGAAYVFQGSTPREVYHEGNLSVSGFVQQPGGSWWTSVTSTASQDSVALRFETTSHTRYFGVGNDGTLRTSTSVQFSSGDLILTSGNTVPMADNGVTRLDNSWDTITQSGVYYNTSSSTAPTNHVRYSLLHMQQPGGQFGQLAIRSGADNFFIRRADSGAVGDWCELYHTGNFDPSTKFDSPSGSTAQYVRGNGSLATFPSIPTSSDYVATSGNQTGLSGDKTWTGNHTFTASSNANSLTVERTGNTARNAFVAYSTSATTIYAGIANVNDTTWGIGTSSNLTSGNTQFQFDTSTGDMSASGTISDSTGDVRKLRFITRNAATTLAASHLNGVVEKSNTTAYIYTIPTGLGSQGDAITFVNSGTGGNLTISRATGVTLFRNGTNANIVVGPGSMVTIYRSATTNRWIA